MKKEKGMFKRAVLSFVATLLIVSFISALAEMKTGVNQYACASLMLALMFVAGVVRYHRFTKGNVSWNSGVAKSAVQQEFWVNYIIGKIFADNSFLMKCFDESDGVLSGSVVHINQAGALPSVTKNRNVFPAVSVRRSDTDVTYALDVYSTDPQHITNAEQKEISYNKMDSVMGEQAGALAEAYSLDMLYKWAGTNEDNIILTSGDASDTALAPSATGTRAKLIKKDLKKAQTRMNKLNIPKEDRYALFPTDLLSDLMDDADLIKRDGVAGGELDLKNGIVLRLYGFAIMERSATTIYSGANAPKSPDADAAEDDNLSVFCWQKNAVAKAMGSKKFFEKLNDPNYYGDVYSSEIKLGGRKRRADEAGVVMIVQKQGVAI